MDANKNKLYEGKAKILYRVDGGSTLIQEFKNSATAFNGLKKGEFEGKAVLNAQISAALFSYLKEKGVPSHFEKLVGKYSHQIQALKMIPLEVVVRNRVAGSLAKRANRKEGEILNPPIVEFFLKDDAQQDPKIEDDSILSREILNSHELEEVRSKALEINQHLSDLFETCQLVLIDFKLEFGLNSHGKILLADEISPDTCRIWDAETKEKYDKDRFRFDLGDLLAGYRVIWSRLQGSLNLLEKSG